MLQNFISKNKYFLLLLIFFIACNQKNMLPKQKYLNHLDLKSNEYSDEILRGSNTAFRDWWNVLHYDITLVPDYKNKSIDGIVVMTFEVTDFKNNGIIQIDMQQPMQIKEIAYLEKNDNSTDLDITEKAFNPNQWVRKNDVYFIDIQELIKNKDKIVRLKFYFEGSPKIAKNAPWDGGWIFSQDKKGRPWMSAAVQGIGASAWFPNKDYWGDEAEQGLRFTIIVPDNLVAIANGKMWESSFVKGENGNNIYTWEVNNPINNYNIIPYIGYYKNLKDQYINKQGDSLALDYWVLDYNVEKAQKHFEQVKPMLQIFEDWMGAYPFYADSYKLVEAPYLGMEHQSNIAYGNNFENGYLGSDRSGTGWGNQFDFIIVHESGHEWFGNNITAQDAADMWIHEAFTTYTEVMYVESRFGLKAANAYVQGLKHDILNDKPIIGEYGKHQEGSVDMYNKGANIIHTLRQWIDDDNQFKKMFKAMQKQFYHQTVTSAQIEGFIADYTGIDLKPFFNQYLRQKNIPVLEIQKRNNKLYYKWSHTIKEFNMPVRLENSDEWIYPTSEWQVYQGKTTIKADPNFLIELR